MNIFATFQCPIQSAKYLDDKRVIKMILESAQLLSTAIFLNASNENPYKPTHRKHPCTIWSAKSRSNYEWLLEHFIALSNEYHIRYNKKHKCLELLLQLSNAKKYITNGPITTFANCTTNKEHNIDFRYIKDIHLAYRLYLAERWKHDKRSAFCNIPLS